MTIESRVLEYLQDVLFELEQEAKDLPPDLGTPPRVLFVEEREPSGHGSLNTGPTRRRWRLTTEQVVPLSKDEPSPDQEIPGMYYDTGRADFAIMSAYRIVRVGWQVGPRYGRGYDFPIESSAEQMPQLGKPKPTWVS